MLLEIISLALAIPVGLLIAHLTKEELKQGRKFFKPLIILSVIATFWFYLVSEKTEALASAFVAITTFVSYTKSFK